ncbi:MAG: signal peptidase I [Mycobacteriaceae bacterium]
MSDNENAETAVDERDDAEQTQPAAQRRGRRRARRASRKKRSFWVELPVLLVISLTLSFLVQNFVARVYVIPSQSMEPTLHGCTGCTNDRVLVDKLSYRFTDPRPGDVVVFLGPQSWDNDFTSNRSSNVVLRGMQEVGALVGLAPPDERDFIKRIIASGGQTVQCCDADGHVQVNGQPLTEPYVVNDFPFEKGKVDCETAPKSQRCFAPVTVPDGHFWMMGDNRNDSADSRYHIGDDARGTVPRGNVIGKARLIVSPISRWQVVNAPQIDARPPR